MAQAVAWNARYKDFQALGYNFVLVSHDTPAKMKTFADARDIGYTMLSDAEAKIVPAFGIANPRFGKGSSWYGVAIPMAFVVAPDGTITHRFSRANYRHDLDIDEILAILKKAASG